MSHREYSQEITLRAIESGLKKSQVAKNHKSKKYEKIQKFDIY